MPPSASAGARPNPLGSMASALPSGPSWLGQKTAAGKHQGGRKVTMRRLLISADSVVSMQEGSAAPECRGSVLKKDGQQGWAACLSHGRRLSFSLHAALLLAQPAPSRGLSSGPTVPTGSRQQRKGRDLHWLSVQVMGVQGCGRWSSSGGMGLRISSKVWGMALLGQQS